MPRSDEILSGVMERERTFVAKRLSVVTSFMAQGTSGVFCPKLLPFHSHLPRLFCGVSNQQQQRRSGTTPKQEDPTTHAHTQPTTMEVLDTVTTTTVETVATTTVAALRWVENHIPVPIREDTECSVDKDIPDAIDQDKEVSLCSSVEVHCRRSSDAGGASAAVEVLLPETERTVSMVQKQPLKFVKVFRLRLLRARHIPRKSICRVYMDGEFIGQAKCRQDEHFYDDDDDDDKAQHVVFDSSAPLEMEGFRDSILRFQVLDKYGSKEIALEEFPLEEILVEEVNQNPNVWLELPSSSSSMTGSASSGPSIPFSVGSNRSSDSLEGPMQLLVRLVETSQCAPPMQVQPSTRKLQAGPNLPRMDSYAVRKMVFQSAAPVTLHVYNVSHSEKVADMNYYIKALGLGGIYHAAVEIHGREYSFGGSSQPNVTGIFACAPKRCPMHAYRESIYLGDCDLSPDQVKAILKDMAPQWMARTYNLFNKNCCFFSRDFCIQLGVGDIPHWVYILAERAEPFDKYIFSAAEVASERARAKKAQERAAAQLAQQQQEQQQHRRRLQNVDSSRDLVDHAMAARLQRTYRNRKSLRQTNEIRLQHCV